MNGVIKIFSFYVLILYATVYCLNAQPEWAPIGAKWYYTSPYYMHEDPGDYYKQCTVMESIKDTMVFGKKCRKIDVRYCSNNLEVGWFIVHQNGDTLSYLNGESFHVLYNFSAKPGDTITVHKGLFIPVSASLNRMNPRYGFQYYVVDTGRIQIYGQWLRRQEVKNTYNSDFVLSKYIVEKIGNYTYFLGRFIVQYIGQAGGFLRCYHDPLLDYTAEGWVNNCGLTEIKEHLTQNELTYFFNQVSKELEIKSQYPINKIMILDILGKIVKQSHYKGEFLVNENFGSFRKGMYIISVTTEYGIFNYKIVNNQ